MTLPTTPMVNELRPDRLRAIITGAPGAGKTTFAAGWYPPTNLIIDPDNGTRFLPGEHLVVKPQTYDEFAGLVTELAQGGHNFTTVTIDTIDTLVRMADSAAGQRGGKVAAGLVEYGKGMADRDAIVMRDINRLLATDLGVIVNAHPAKVTLTDENGAESERIFPRIDQQDRIRQEVIGRFDFLFVLRRNPDETRALVTGGSPLYETKRRVALPDVMAANPGDLYAAVKQAVGALSAAPAQPVAA